MAKRAISVVCLLCLLVSQARAATFNVTNTNDDTNAGSLRTAITNSNGAGGANTISWLGTGGTILLGSSLPAINGSTTLDATNATSAVTINDSNSSIPLAGAATFNNGSTTQNWTISAIISGAGSLTQTGAGTLVLTGANTFAGGSFLNGGILNINNGSALGTGAVSFNGGTLQMGNFLTLSNAITVTAGGGTVDTNGFNATLSGAIGGAGAFTKAGAGTLTLTAQGDTYGGATAINAGTLFLANSNILPAGTAVTVAAGAMLDITGGAQTVASYTGPGALRLQVGAATPLTVTGNANFTGGSIAVLPSGTQAIKTGDSFTAITYGSKTGTASIVSPAAVTFTPNFQAGSLLVTATLVPLASVASTPNQAAVGAALEPLRGNPTGDVSTVLSQLYQLDAPGLGAALDSLTPIALASMGAIGMASASVESAAVSRRMTALADGSDAGGFSAYRVTRRSQVPGDLIASAGIGDAGDGTVVAGPDSRWGTFGSLVGTIGDASGASFSGGNQPGYTFSAGGVIGGVDYRLNDHFAVGTSVGYLAGQSSTYTSAGGQVNSNSGRLGVYASGHSDGLRADLYAGGAADTFSTQRYLSFGAIQRTATANPSGTEFNLASSLSYDLRSFGWGTVSPMAGVNYTRMMIGSFTEGGADSMDLSVSGQTIESLQSDLGWRIQFKTATQKAVPYLSLAWRHEFIDQNRVINASFASLPTSPFSTSTGGFARDGAAVGTGVKFKLSKRATFQFDYAGDFRQRYDDSDLSGTLRVAF